MTAVDPERFCEWLYFCSQNSSDHGEIAFDDKGMIAPRELPYRGLPFGKASFWAYYEYARDSGFLENANDNGAISFRFQISNSGLTFIAENHAGWWNKQFRKLGENFLTIIVSVVIAVLTSWAAYYFGPANGVGTEPHLTTDTFP